MATIRLLYRSGSLLHDHLFRKSCQPITRLSALTFWSSAVMTPKMPKLLTQTLAVGLNKRPLVRRSMSYVSNIKRFSGRYQRTGRLMAFGVAIGSIILLFETMREYVNKKIRSKRLLSSAAKLLAAEEVPQISPTRIVSGPTDLGMSLTLFQYQSCPFCCKVRAFLDYYGIPYNVVEVNPVLRQQLKFSKYRKVPILLVQTKDEVLQLNDSTTIVSALSSYLISRKPESRISMSDQSIVSIADWYKENEVVIEDGVKNDEIVNKYFLMFGDIDRKNLKSIETSVAEERNWRRWTDDYLVHTLSPNIYRTFDESLRSFKHFSEVGEWDKNFAVWEKYLCIYMGSTAMYFIGKRLKKKHKLDEDVRNSLYFSCKKWLKALGKDRKFMGGDGPNLADLSVFGVLNSIEGCDAFNDLIDKTGIGKWYYSVKELVKNKAGAHQLNYLKQ